MSTVCMFTRHIGDRLLSEKVGWVLMVTTIVAIAVLSAVASTFGWNDAFAFALIALLSFGTVVGMSTFLKQEGWQEGHTLFPTKSIEYLGLIGLGMFTTSLLFWEGRFLELVFG